MTASAAEKVFLFYQHSASPLKGDTHYLENDTSIKILSRKGQSEDEVIRKDTFRSMEMRKKMIINPISLSSAASSQPARFFMRKEVIEVVREDSNAKRPQKLDSYSIENKFDSAGHMQQEMKLGELPYISFPVIFPQEPIEVGHRWSNTQEVEIEKGVSIALNVDYTLDRIVTISGYRTAEISFMVKAELKSTEVTDNPVLLQTIDMLRNRGIEKIGLSGTGKMAFNIDEHLPMLQTLDLVFETAQRRIGSTEREVSELIREIHKAEVLLAR
jgi:hypothetical protein